MKVLGVKTGNFKRLLTVYLNAFGILWQASPGYTFIAMFNSVARALIVPWQIYLAQLVIHQITLSIQSGNPNWQTMALLIPAMGFCGL